MDLARAVGHTGGAEDGSLVVGEDVYTAAVSTVVFYDLLACGEAVVNSTEFGVEDFRGVAHRDGFVYLAGQAVGDAVGSPRLSLELRAIGVGDDVLGVGAEVTDERGVFDGGFGFGELRYIRFNWGASPRGEVRVCCVLDHIIW
jgi:hypothetical protein